MKTTKRDILISKINALDGLTADEKAQITEYIREKTFGLVWENKPEKAEDVLKESFPVFEEVPERRIFNGEQYPNHIIIEGDNLHALTALRYTHERKIDVIYIDPPYNTGNKDFVYNDSFVDKEDGFRHSKWLSFMEKRLTIAKELLSDKGVIFVSIDDNEMAECKLLLEKIYGVGNFVACAIRRTINSGKHDATTLAPFHEYLLIFARDIKNVVFAKKKKQDDESDRLYKLTDDYVNERGRYYITQLNKNSIQYSDSLNYPIIGPDGIEIWPGGGFEDKIWVWRWSKQKVQWGIENGFIVFKKNKDNKYKVYTKSYEYVDKDGNEIVRSNPYSTLEFINKEYANFNATPDLQKIFGGEKVFSFPKSIEFITEILRMVSVKNSTVLDFFAGSGTTLHAAMLLNEEDGGHRQCILVTNNENQICENVTYERNRRVINGYPDPKGQMVMGLHANNLRYYRTAFVSQDRTRQNKLRLVRLAVDLLCIKEDVYEEQSSFFTIENINKQDFRYFSENGKRLLVIFNEDIITQIVDTIKMADFEGVVKFTVFRPTAIFIATNLATSTTA